MRGSVFAFICFGSLLFGEVLETTDVAQKCCPSVESRSGPDEKRWYFEVEPGYYYFTDPDMRTFFDNGGFTIRAEMGYRFYKLLSVWIDGGYFEKSGRAIGGDEELKLRLATLTLGLKWICYFHPRIAFYAGAGPRVFMMMLHNDSPFVRSDDNEIGIGGGFDGGIRFFPSSRWSDLFFDAFVDYSWKDMGVEPDEISSLDSDVNLSGISAGLGVGIRF